MDLVGVTVIATFAAMMLVGAFAVLSQNPPLERVRVICPQDRTQAHVILAWDRAAKAVKVAGCDHWTGCHADCHDACLEAATKAFPRMPATTVMG